MAKFDFNSSRYARFFGDKENQRFLQTFLDNSEIFFTNKGWYKTQGSKDTEETPTAADGTATFSVKARKLQAPHLMDLRAPLGDTIPEDTEGIQWYSATIPDFSAAGIVETAAERYHKMQEFEVFGNDRDIVDAWTQKVQTGMDQVDSTLNWLTASLMSTGGIDYSTIGRGVRVPLHKAAIPSANFRNGGAKAWAADGCNLLTQLRTLERTARDDMGGYDGPMIWQMTRNDYYNVFLKNAEVRSFVSDFRKMNYLASTQNIPVTESEWNKAMVDLEGVSPIEIVVEKEYNHTYTKTEAVQGWKDGTVVLRPAGDAVKFMHKRILDHVMVENFGAKTISSVFGSTNDGLGLLINSTVDNGRFREWHTDVLLAACPALVEFPNHFIYDITKAD